MLDTAEVLSLTTSSFDKVADAVAQGSHSIAQLQQLCTEVTGSAEACCLLWLLNRATKLTILVASVSVKLWFPPMLKSLKHIVLDFSTADAGNVCSALTSAAALQTLCLSGRKLSSPTESHMILDKLVHLEVFALKGIEPEVLHIPKGCRMHLSGIGNSDITKDVWKESLANMRSVGGYLIWQYGRSSMENLLNRQLRPAKNVSAMGITLYSECRYEDMRKDMLQGIEHLERVLFDGGDVVLYLPANIKWEVAIFEGGKIALDFEDVTKFVRTVRKFGATFKSMRSTWLADLRAALTAQGISWASTERDAKGNYKFWFPAGEYPAKCWCGACLDCLVAAGQAVAPCVNSALEGDVQYNTGPSVYEDESAEGEDEEEDYDYDEDEEDGMWGHGNHYTYGIRDSDDEYYYN